MVFFLQNLNYKLLLGILFAFFLASTTTFAFKMTYESFIATEPSKLEFGGNFSGGQFGATMASGDFNADGIDDLLVSAPFSSIDEKQWNGAVQLLWGGENTNSAYFYGDDAGDQLGTSLAVGDFNADGIDDIAMGAHKAYYEGSRTGKVYVIYGSYNLPAQINDSQDNSFRVEIVRGLSDAGFGLAIKAADINNDGIDDLLVGAPFTGTWKVEKSGTVYSFMGSINGLSPKYNTVFYGQKNGERFGSYIDAADFDNDGQNELFIGAYLSDVRGIQKAGKVYYYDVNGEIFKNPLYIFLSYNFYFEGKGTGELFGFSFDLGDVNNDGIDDLAVSSFPYGGNQNLAKISIFYGGKLNKTPDIIIENPINDSLIGSSVLIDDFNLDNIGDIAIGAPGISSAKSTDEGDVYMIFSNDNGYKGHYSIKDLEVDSIINGENQDDWFGYSLESLDFNNDGIKDLAVGARYSDTPESVNNGKVYILLGEGGLYGNLKAVLGEDKAVSRAELVRIILGSFDIREKKADYIRNCYDYIDFCLFNFMAMSSYDDIRLSPELILYPDVLPDYDFYDDINTATILDLVNGYMNDINSPFNPDIPVTRIQALKIVLGAADLVPAMYKFELVAMLGSYLDLTNQNSYFADVDSNISHMWWYPRYVNFAVENNIVDDEEYFRPDENITIEELNDMINRTLTLINP